MDSQHGSLQMIDVRTLADSPAAEIAAREGRLWWRCTDGDGRPANGGSADPLPLGEWSPTREPVLCCSGWHVTSDPLRWRGSRVWLVEVDAVHQRDGDKAVAARIRPLAEVDPAQCLCPRIGARLGRRDLRGADLRGADLRGAYLREADLAGADLAGAYLRRADLGGADLREADLGCADLRWADLREADLGCADLRWADLREADLRGADLRGAYLGDWERGPAGYARMVAP